MFTRNVTVIGTGYVGLTTGACLASLGHHVVCVDVDELKVARLRRGEIPILEPSLQGLVTEGQRSRRLHFTVDTQAAVADAEVIFLCVPTPMGLHGAADLTIVEAVFDDIRGVLPAHSILVNKSTVPVGTAARTAALLGRDDVAVVSNPEFLREGSAVADFLHPDRIVVGSDSGDAAERVSALYTRLGAPTVLTDAASAEMIKYAANGFLAMKLSYVNTIAELCERLGADIRDVTEGVGHDHRIGHAFLAPGPGWGGSCLPKDSHALRQIAATADVQFPLLDATLDTNTYQGIRVVNKIRAACGLPVDGSLVGQRIALLGLAFKAGTNDLRDSPALTIAARLRAEGAWLTAYDPAIPPADHQQLDGITVTASAENAARDADVLVILTEWPHFRRLDFRRLAELVAHRRVVDTRNLLDADTITRCGFSYHGSGIPSRQAVPAGEPAPINTRTHTDGALALSVR